jgi:hypothetical protein
VCLPLSGPGSLNQVSDNLPSGPADDRDLPEQTRDSMTRPATATSSPVDASGASPS